MSIWRAVQSGSWLTAARAVAYCRILLWLTVVLVAAEVGLALLHGGWVFSGKTLGTDFLCFWTAARLAVAGTPADAYDPAIQYALERATFGGADPGYYAFIYPPITLLLCLPLGLLPYLPALLVWIAVTGTGYFAVIRAILARDRLLVPAILAFPAVLVNCGHGQNAFLTTALFGGGLLMLRNRPLLAGILFGSLAVKPHLGLLIPVYLLAGRHGRAFVAACAAVALWTVLSLLAFGTATWIAYLKAASLARVTLEQGLVEPEKMQSVFAAVRLWHGSLPLAYAAQGGAAVLVAAVLVILARRRSDSLGGGAALVTGALLTTPYVLDYDLTLLAIPLAWLAAEARKTGFRGWERPVALAAFLLPLVSRLVATTLALPLGPLVIAALFWVVCRRVWSSPAVRTDAASWRSHRASPIPRVGIA